MKNIIVYKRILVFLIFFIACERKNDGASDNNKEVKNHGEYEKPQSNSLVTKFSAAQQSILGDKDMAYIVNNFTQSIIDTLSKWDVSNLQALKDNFDKLKNVPLGYLSKLGEPTISVKTLEILVKKGALECIYGNGSLEGISSIERILKFPSERLKVFNKEDIKALATNCSTNIIFMVLFSHKTLFFQVAKYLDENKLSAIVGKCTILNELDNNLIEKLNYCNIKELSEAKTKLDFERLLSKY